jgi:hypothetical protein
VNNRTDDTRLHADRGLEVEDWRAWQPISVGERTLNQRPGGKLLSMREGGCVKREALEQGTLDVAAG